MPPPKSTPTQLYFQNNFFLPAVVCSCDLTRIHHHISYSACKHILEKDLYKEINYVHCVRVCVRWDMGLIFSAALLSVKFGWVLGELGVLSEGPKVKPKLLVDMFLLERTSQLLHLLMAFPCRCHDSYTPNTHTNKIKANPAKKNKTNCC